MPEGPGFESVISRTASAEGARRALEARRRDLARPLVALARVVGMDALREVHSAVELVRLVDGAIARLDRLVETQVNEILHAPAFQALEASWRGLSYLVERAAELEDPLVKIRVLSITWSEIERDLERAAEFDQSRLFRKIYSDEFGMPGGEPYGVILGDYEVRTAPSAEHPTDDISIARGLSEIGAAALAPVVLAAHPSFFGCEEYSDIIRLRDLATIVKTAPWNVRWRSVRTAEDSRYLAMTLPRVLRRLPYEADGTGSWGFRFREETVQRVRDPENPAQRHDRDAHLWGTAIYAYGAVLMRAFNETGWFADIRGTRVDEAGGGLVPSTLTPSFATDAPGVAPKLATDAVLSPHVESQLSELGFLPLNRCWLTDRVAFQGSQSVHDPTVYSSDLATANARLTALLQYVLCAARFGHYIKVLVRDHVGSFITAKDCERFLRTWLHRYTANIDNISPQMRAQNPLRDASVEVTEDPLSPGGYRAVVRLQPHYQADELVSSLKLVTEIAQVSPS